MIEDKIQIDEEIKKLPFIEHYKKCGRSSNRICSGLFSPF